MPVTRTGTLRSCRVSSAWAPAGSCLSLRDRTWTVQILVGIGIWGMPDHVLTCHVSSSQDGQAFEIVYRGAWEALHLVNSKLHSPACMPDAACRS